MADGASGGSEGPKVKSKVAPVLRGGRRAPLQPGRNLLPPRMKTLPRSSDAVRGRTVPGSSSSKKLPPPNMQKVNDAYDRYLIDFLNLCTLQEAKKLNEAGHVEAGMTSLINVLATSPKVRQQYITKVLLKIFDDLKQVDMLGGVFEDLLGFAGEEALMEIQTLLTRKFEKIGVVSGEVDRPLFKDIEIASLVEKVRLHLSKNLDTSKMSGYTNAFESSMRRIYILSEQTLKRNAQLRLSNNILLEFCSLAICSLAHGMYMKEENVMGLVDKEGEGANEELDNNEQ